jgi:hypothetical protein
LDAAQVTLYRADWVKRVEAKREREHGPKLPATVGAIRALRYLQTSEKNEEYSYEFKADYVLVESGEPAADMETNLCINSFVTSQLQRFRADAMTNRAQIEKIGSLPFRSSLAISHTVPLFLPEVLSLEFQLWRYHVGAAHPNMSTKTLAFRLHPSVPLQLEDVFNRSTKYLEALSNYCVNDLRKQKMLRWHNPKERRDDLESMQDGWIMSGAGPESRNFEKFSFRNYGVVFHFDPYQAGCYAEGKYEVFVTAYELRPIINKEIASLLGWI